MYTVYLLFKKVKWTDLYIWSDLLKSSPWISTILCTPGKITLFFTQINNYLGCVIHLFFSCIASRQTCIFFLHNISMRFRSTISSGFFLVFFFPRCYHKYRPQIEFSIFRSWKQNYPASFSFSDWKFTDNVVFFSFSSFV